MDDKSANRIADPASATPNEPATKPAELAEGTTDTAKPTEDAAGTARSAEDAPAVAEPIANATPAEPLSDGISASAPGTRSAAGADAQPSSSAPAAEPGFTPPAAGTVPMADTTQPAAFSPAGYLPSAGPAAPSTATAGAGRPTRLVRSRSNRMVAGVCGGLAELLNIDAVILRLALVLATVLGFGAGVILYLACWLLMPKEPERTTDALS